MPVDPYKPFTMPAETFWQSYKTWQDQLVGHFEYAAEQLGMSQLEISAIGKSATSNSALFDVIKRTKGGYDLAKTIRDSFRTDVLNINAGYVQDSWLKLGLGGSGEEVGRAVPNATKAAAEHPLSFILRGMSFTKSSDPALTGADVYKSSFNIPRQEFIQSLYDRRNMSIEPGKRMFVFDTETLGLSTDSATVREISGVSMYRNDGGFYIDESSDVTKHMRVNRSAYGAIRDHVTGKVQRMDNFIKQRIVGSSGVSEVGGKGFLEAARPMLEEMAQADYLVGHNVGFDIGQVITNTMRTAEYARNPALRQLVNQVRSKEVIDTVTMVSEYFGGKLGVAPDLVKPSSYSLENLMLQTNLGDLLKNDESIPGFMDDYINLGQHQAKIDTTITGKLLQYMQEGRLNDTPLSDPRLRKAVLTSYALTPISNIADVRHVTPELFEQLMDEDGSVVVRQVGTGKVIPTDRTTVIGGKPVSMSPGEWYEQLTDPANVDQYATMKITPMEQHIFNQRQLFDAVDPVGDVHERVGAWAKFSGYGMKDGGFLNANHTLTKAGLMPSDQAFGRFQKEMAAAGMPYAGHSLPERVLGAGLSIAGQGIQAGLGSAEIAAMPYLDDLMSSRWMNRAEFYTAPSGVSAMPLDVLRRAEEAGSLLDTNITGSKKFAQMMSLSTVESTRDLNLMVELSERDQAGLMDWLQQGVTGEDMELRKVLSEAQLSETTLADWGEGFLAGDGRVNVGHMGEQGYDVISNLMQENTRDLTKIPMQMGLISGSSDSIVMGAPVLERFRTDEMKVRYAEDLRTAASMETSLVEEMSSSPSVARKVASKYSSLGTVGERVAAKGEAAFDALKKRAPIGIGAAALVFGGYYANKRRKQQDVYDESMSDMSYESQADYDNYRYQMSLPPAPAQRMRLDPLMTAGVVGNMNNNRIGHTNMDPNRHMGLFQGV